MEPRRSVTVLESVDEIRALLGRPPTLKTPGAPAAAPAPLAPPGEDTRPFRPTRRPEMAVLVVLDDGHADGQEVRLRADSFVIGRVEGDLVIPHDGGISGRHAEIRRVVEGGVGRWVLKDLRSTNGTFVRASSALLKHGQELWVGNLRLRFEQATAAAPVPSGLTSPATRKWSVGGEVAPADPAPTLIVIGPEGERGRHRLVGDELWLGRDPGCALALDDPMTSPRHARIARDGRGRWTIHNNRSLNGLWVRVEQVPLGRGGQFQCGEQRFLFRVV